MTAHFDQKISFFTSFTEISKKIYISSRKNYDDLFLDIDPKSSYFHCFSQLSITFSLQKHPFITLSSLDIFIYHCTFCVSLHVRTHPG